LDEPQGFCDKCGTKTGHGAYGTAAPQQMICVREKSTGIAALLSFLWAGLGQIYVGQIGRGLLMMIGYFLIAFTGVFFVLAGGLFGIFTGGFFGGLGGAIGGFVIFLAIMIALWVFNIFDAYKLANEYNDAIKATGRRPW
jgi:hypothetical protein